MNAAGAKEPSWNAGAWRVDAPGVALARTAARCDEVLSGAYAVIDPTDLVPQPVCEPIRTELEYVVRALVRDVPVELIQERGVRLGRCHC